jgi:acetylornithine/succinyldiaminopimelate/putrescine aminotransferase/predicted amino acid dehydrogenase
MENHWSQTTQLLFENSKEISFGEFSRPLTSKLLEAMELNKNYIQGEGDYLYYAEDDRVHKVLDLTGGYGSNLLGHKNPRILNVLNNWIHEGAPNLTQGSNRAKSGLLAKKISDLLKVETGEGPWITTFSNSGTEAIEAALKHALLSYGQKLTDKNQQIEKEINLSHLVCNSLSQEKKKTALTSLRKQLEVILETASLSKERKSYALHQNNNLHSLEEFVNFLREMNSLQLNVKPKFIALEKSYHGKTMGSLSLTYSQAFRDPFYIGEEFNKDVIFISQYIDELALEKIINSQKVSLFSLDVDNNNLVLIDKKISYLAAAFVEPIQGEAGIIPVENSFLSQLKKFSLKEDFLLVFDEIQAGMYRTGTLSSGSHSDITADIYTFSKSLGGGVAKIAATTILAKKYVEEFGFLHTSTFSDDDLSASIALEVLEILTEELSPLKRALEASEYLKMRLDWLKESFPAVIKDIRGKGLLLAIEFNDHFKDMGFEFKMICDARMQGYLLSSALLNHEGVRMNPSLSNNLTLRIAPSISFTIMQAEEIFVAIRNVAENLEKRDVKYFLSALNPHEEVENNKTPDLKTSYEKSLRPLSVFLCHLIDENHVKKVTHALKKVSEKKLTKKLALTKEIADFQIYHTQVLKDNEGKEMDIIMLGVPITSEELKRSFLSKNKYRIIDKVQKAVDYAFELGASTVGLGQFSSIVSGNGLYLNPRGMNLTTGNAFTTALTVQAALRSAKDQNLDSNNLTSVVVGAAGNIMSVASSLIADEVSKLILIHHSPIEASLKYQEAVKRIIQEILSSESLSKVVKTVKAHWDESLNIVDFLNIKEIKEVFVSSSDINDISEGDIVLCGASSSNGFIDIHMFKKNGIIVDVAVPPSIKQDQISLMTTKRPDLTYHLGGVANIPQNLSIDFFIFPLPENECYACMAETFTIGLSGERDILNIGDLNKTMVKKIEALASKVGFTLGSYKTKSSL